MTDRHRRPRSAERDRPVTDDGVDVDEIGVNRAGLGSPPANVDDSHRPDLFDIEIVPLSVFKTLASLDSSFNAQVI